MYKRQRPLVTDVYGNDPDHLLQLAASLEQTSRHPLAYALLQEAQRRELTLRECGDVRTVSGQGLEGHVDGASARVRVGKPDWLEGQGVAIAPAAQDWLSAAEGSVVAVAVGGVLVGLVQIEDQLRPDVAPALQRLRSHGLCLLYTSPSPRD